MAKFIVLYDEPKDKAGFDDHYHHVHIPLVNEMPNLKQVSMDRIVKTQNTNENVYLHVVLEFENIPALNESMSSEAGKKVAADAQNLAPFLTSPPKIFITE